MQPPIKRIAELVKKYLHLRFKLRPNAKYTNFDYLALLVHTARENAFAEGISNFYPNLPSADSLFYHLKKFTIVETRALFTASFDRMFDSVKHLFNRPVYLAIDCHDIPYYGDRSHPFVIGSERQKGTNYAFRFITVNIVEPGRRFTLLALPVHQFNTKAELTKKLLLYAKSKVKIKAVLFDKNFYSVDVINALKDLQLKFLMPAPNNRKVRRLLEEHSNTILPYEMCNATGKVAHFKLAIVTLEDQKYVYATTLSAEPMALPWIYDKRWGIETSYRVKEEDFSAKTCAREYVVRLFYFLFAVCLYNLWILANIGAGTAFAVQTMMPVIIAKAFMIALCFVYFVIV